jgi:HD-GYP domain-containing protein (c-di-GMP phosphodiesterase class II)
MAYDRPYRRSLGHNGTIRQLTAGAGTQFDPEQVAAFVTLPIAPLRFSTLNRRHRRDEPRESLAKYQARSIHVR